MQFKEKFKEFYEKMPYQPEKISEVIKLLEKNLNE